MKQLFKIAFSNDNRLFHQLNNISSSKGVTTNEKTLARIVRNIFKNLIHADSYD